MKYFDGRFFIFFFIVCVIFSATLFGKVTIVVSSGPFESIERAAVSEKEIDFWDDDFSDDNACTECFAATELAVFLPGCVEISSDEIFLSNNVNELPEGDCIIIGSRQSNRLVEKFTLPAGAELENEQSFSIRSFEDSGRVITVIQGFDRAGSLYGVYDYLETLGIWFVGLGERGMVWPTEKLKKLPVGLNITESPSFVDRGYKAWEDRDCGEEFFLWMARNRVNFWTSAEQPVHFLKKLCMRLAWGDVDIQARYFKATGPYPYNHKKFKGDENKPADPYQMSDDYIGDANSDGSLSYFEAHPEWFCLYKGKRSNYVPLVLGHNFCMSNKDALDEFCGNVIKSLIEGEYKYVDVLRLRVYDLCKWCECENCQSIGTFSDRNLDLAYQLMTRMKKAQQQGRLKRKVTVLIGAYTEAIAPPTKPLPVDFDFDNLIMMMFPIERCYVHGFADPKCSEINCRLKESFLGWKNSPYFTGTMGIAEFYNVSGIKSLPMVYMRIMPRDIPWFYRNGVRHMVYMHVMTKLWGTWTLNQQLFAKLLWDAELDADKFIDDYFKRYYPTTCENTRKFYEHLEDAMCNIKTFKYFVRNTKWEAFTFQKWRAVEGLQKEQNRLCDPEQEIFELEHLKYNKYSPQLNDGPDVVEIMESMRLARKYIDQSLMLCSDKVEQSRLVEDEKRFAYGEAMYNFIYHLIRTGMFHHEGNSVMARTEFASVKLYAEELKKMIDVVNSASEDVNSKNGYEATQMTPIFDFFNAKYGQ